MIWAFKSFASEILRVGARPGTEQFKAVGNGSNGAAAGASDLGHTHRPPAIKAEDSEDARRIQRSLGIDLLKEQECRSKVIAFEWVDGNRIHGGLMFLGSIIAWGVGHSQAERRNA